MRLIFILILAVLLHGCSSSPVSEDLESGSQVKRLVDGKWYFHMGCGDFLEMDLEEGGTFKLAVVSVPEGDSKNAPGGTWSLQDGIFRLIWRDGTTKTQTLLSITDTVLRLENSTNTEIYLREPDVEAHNKAKQ